MRHTSTRTSAKTGPERQPSRRHLSKRAWAAIGAAATIGTLGSGGLSAASAAPHKPGSKHPAKHSEPPINVTVFSPGNGDISGSAAVGFIVDVALDARKAHFNGLLSSANGYKQFFNDPMAPTFHPGPDPGAPGLVVLLSTTPSKPGTPLQGPNTNLAGLFQINGVATVHGTAETWNTWQPGKPIFGAGKSTLTVYVVAGTAPTIVPPTGLNVISNVVRVQFTIAS